MVFLDDNVVEIGSGLCVVCNFVEDKDCVSVVDGGAIQTVDEKIQSDKMFKDAVGGKAFISVQIKSSLSRKSIVRRLGSCERKAEKLNC